MEYTLEQAGVFHRLDVKTDIVHLARDTELLLHGAKLEDQLASENIVKDSDGSYWIALYHRCVHLGCIVPFRDVCSSFKCPCHGSHHNVDGEWLGKPAPRSMDLFAFAFVGEDLVVDTGKLNNTVSIPDDTTRIISIQTAACFVENHAVAYYGFLLYLSFTQPVSHMQIPFIPPCSSRLTLIP